MPHLYVQICYTTYVIKSDYKYRKGIQMWYEQEPEELLEISLEEKKAFWDEVAQYDTEDYPEPGDFESYEPAEWSEDLF